MGSRDGAILISTHSLMARVPTKRKRSCRRVYARGGHVRVAAHCNRIYQHGPTNSHNG